MSLSPQDQTAVDLLNGAKTVALVGLSDNPARASYEIFAWLKEQGYRVYGVNPALAGKTVLGDTVLAALREVPEPIDMVDIFRNSEAAGGVVDEAIAVKAKAVWMQLGVIDEAAAARARAAGLQVVMDRCPKIEARRLKAYIRRT